MDAAELANKVDHPETCPLCGGKTNLEFDLYDMYVYLKCSCQRIRWVSEATLFKMSRQDEPTLEEM